MAYLIISLFFLSCSLYAKDLGSYGTTFMIKEESLIDVLKERLKTTLFNENAKSEIQKTFIATAKNPKGKTFPRAQQNRQFEFDPSIIAREDIRDQEGNLMIAKGTKVNPLDKNSLPEPLLIFDGKDQEQVSWAKKNFGIWILTNGNPLNLEECEHRPVYFDQAGYLTKKLGIYSLPAKVTQENKKLKIEEISCF